MPLFSGHRHDEGSIEYAAVGHEATYSDDVNTNGNQQYDDTIDGTHRSLDVGDQDSSNASKSKGTNYRVLESSRTPSDEVAGGINVPTIAGWPQGPRKLKGVSIPFLIGDTLLILLPIAFLVLAISAWRLDGKELSDTGKIVERAMNLGPTIYPLAFAAISSRCLRSIAIRLAQSGTTISMLEKLLGSQSLVSAIGTAFTLRSANLLSIALLLLWALSPLGGQSSLRLLHETNTTISETGTIYFSDPAAPMNLLEASTWFTLVPTVLGASLAVSEEVKSRPVDLWSHPKIPRLDAVEQIARGDIITEGDWISVGTNPNITYSSWAGINIQGLLPNKHATFQVKSNYMYLNCEKLYGGTRSEVVEFLQNPDISFFPTLNTEGQTPEYANVSYENALFDALVMNEPKNFIQNFSFFLRAAWNSTDSGKSKNETTPSTLFDQQPVNFWYGASYKAGEDEKKVVHIHSCAPHIVTLEAGIDCEEDTCEVTQVRNIPSDPESQCRATSGYILDCLTKASHMLQHFLRFFPTAVSAGYSSAVLNPFDDYIAGSNETYRTSPTDHKRILDNIPDRMISDRLTTLLNTYWQAGSWGTQVTRANLYNQPEYPWNGTADSTAPERFINATEAVFSHQIPVYRADIGWIVSLILITTILLLLGLVNVAMSFLTIAPDLFYYASSLARENPYTNIPDGGTALDGAERSRLLKRMKVQIADVSPDNNIGYVVLKSVEKGDDFRNGRLRKDRLYW